MQISHWHCSIPAVSNNMHLHHFPWYWVSWACLTKPGNTNNSNNSKRNKTVFGIICNILPCMGFMVVRMGPALFSSWRSKRCTKPGFMPWLHVKYVYFKIVSGFGDVRLKWFYFGAWKLAWNYFKIISQGYCSSWICSYVFIVAEIILQLVQRLK